MKADDLPERVVVGANGAYWRDFGDGYSMCPVSDDNDPVTPVAVYVRTALSVPGEPPGLTEAWAEVEAALPEGWRLLVGNESGGWWATASSPRLPDRSYRIVSTSHDGALHLTPAAACTALALLLEALP